jgi:hypothetical protein
MDPVLLEHFINFLLSIRSFLRHLERDKFLLCKMKEPIHIRNESCQGHFEMQMVHLDFVFDQVRKDVNVPLRDS